MTREGHPPKLLGWSKIALVIEAPKISDNPKQIWETPHCRVEYLLYIGPVHFKKLSLMKVWPEKCHFFKEKVSEYIWGLPKVILGLPKHVEEVFVIL